MLRYELRAFAALLCCTLAMGIVLADTRSAAGDDFRVGNKIFVGSSKTPYSQSTTIFHQGMVYDYLDSPAEIIVLDKAGGRFVLLDTVRKVRAQVTLDDVVQFTRHLQESAGNHSDPFVNFLAAPTLERVDADTEAELEGTVASEKKEEDVAPEEGVG